MKSSNRSLPEGWLKVLSQSKTGDLSVDGNAREAVCKLSRSRSDKVTRRFLQRNRVWISWFHQRRRFWTGDDDCVRISAIRVAFAYKLHTSISLNPRWELLADIDKYCRYLLRVLGFSWGKRPQQKERKKRSPRRGGPRLRAIRRVAERVFEPPPDQSVQQADIKFHGKMMKLYASRPDHITNWRYLRGPDHVPTCRFCGEVQFRLEMESRFRLPIDDDARRRVLFREQDPYVRRNLAATSGFYTGVELHDFLRDVNVHEMYVADAHWRRAHPYVCGCYFGEQGAVMAPW
jgi:hypothetical protein